MTDCHIGGVMWRAIDALDLSSPPLHYKQLRGELQHENGEKGTKRKLRGAGYIYERESLDCFCLVTITEAVCILRDEEEGWEWDGALCILRVIRLLPTTRLTVLEPR